MHILGCIYSNILGLCINNIATWLYIRVFQETEIYKYIKVLVQKQ